MKTWQVEVIPSVEERLIQILTYIDENPLYNPDAAISVFEDFEATVKRVGLMGDRIPIGNNPVMRSRSLRRISFQSHRYYLIFRLIGDTAQIVRIGHDLEDLDKVLR